MNFPFPPTDPAAPAGARASGGPSHPFLCTDALAGKVAKVSATGVVEWEHRCENPQDCWITPDGNYLFSFAGGVVEKLSEGRTLWDYTAPEGYLVAGCQPLPNGHFIVLESGPCRIVEINNMGNVLKKIWLAPPPPGVAIEDQFRGLRRTAEGNFLVCRKAEREVEEVDPTGRSVRRIAVPGDPHVALQLPNGNLLLALGDGHRLEERDARGAVVWALAENDLPGNRLQRVTGFHRLPNGNTVVCNYPTDEKVARQPVVLEVTPAKQVVWSYSDPARFAAINQIQLADVPGDVMKGELLR